jgi:hypothetical protein
VINIRSVVLPVTLGLLIAGHLALATQLGIVRRGMAVANDAALLLPTPVLKLVALEYRDLLADLIFSRTVNFFGGKLHRREHIDEQTYRTIYHRLDTASELDPYFVDPYFFGQAVLTWGANMPREANALLDRGRRFRTDDWILPFFMGFNAFYFLHDFEQGAAYLVEASRRPGSPPSVGLLAARFASRSGGIDTAIGVLESMVSHTDDASTRALITTRIQALRGMRVLEQAVERYRGRYATAPRDLGALVTRGILPQIPRDPYGGSFYLTSDGKIWTTSELRPVKQR